METAPNPKKSLADLVFAPFYLLIEFPLVPIGALVMAALLGVYVYYWVNIDLFGLGRADYKNLQFNKYFATITIQLDKFIYKRIY